MDAEASIQRTSSASPVTALMIDGVAGADIGADHKVIHGGFPESLVVERVELFGHLVVAEILAVQVAGAQQIAEAGIAFVIPRRHHL